MVTNVTSLGRSGLHDWVAQRVSAVVLLLYVLFLGYVFLTTPELDYQSWRNLFATEWVRIFTLLTILSLCAHAWVGMWTIGTDYLTTRMMGRAGSKIRFLYELACLIVLFVYLVWTIRIVWSI